MGAGGMSQNLSRGRRHACKAFPEPVIQFLHDQLDLGRGQLIQVSPLGKVLSNEAVGVLIQAAPQW